MDGCKPLPAMYSLYTCGSAGCSTAATRVQGLTLVHVSAQLEHILRDALGA